MGWQSFSRLAPAQPSLRFVRWHDRSRIRTKSTRRTDPVGGRGHAAGQSRPGLCVSLNRGGGLLNLARATKNPPKRRVAQSSHRDFRTAGVISHGAVKRETPFPASSLTAPPRRRNGITILPDRARHFVCLSDRPQRFHGASSGLTMRVRRSINGAYGDGALR
jgi:hypothetical protein